MPKLSEVPTLGWLMIDWIERYLVHGPGDVEGEPIRLDDEMAIFIARAYQLRPDGRRRLRRAVFSRAKGRAKSELAAMLAIADSVGPSRFAGWDAKGQPLGAPPPSPEVLCVATEERQAGNVYDHVRYMLSHGAVARIPGVQAGLTRSLVPGGVIEPVTASADAKDGGRSTFVVFDETHLFNSPGLRKLHATVRRNLAKRRVADPWSLEVSTMYRPGEESVAELSHRYARQVATGEVEDDSFYFDHVEAPANFNWKSDRELRKALTVAYGAAADWMDLDRIVRECRDPQADEADSRRYWLNQAVKATSQWMSISDWDALAVPGEVEAGTPITLGFDGSRFDDATALVACRISDGYVFVPKLGDRPTVWERPIDADEWEVPRIEVDAAVNMMFDRYSVRRMYADPPQFEDTVDRWAAEHGEKAVVAWWTNRKAPMARAVERFAGAVRARELHHDGSPVLSRHVGNAHRDRTQHGSLLRKETRLSARKIDAAMAAVLAYEARGDCVSTGDARPNRRSAYEDAGLMAV